MRFTEFLDEAKKKFAPQKGDQLNMPHNFGKQFVQPKPAPAQPAATPAGTSTARQPPPNAPGAQPAKPDATKAPVPKELEPYLNFAKQSRDQARDFITLLGAMYQAKRVNPNVQMTVPKIVSQEKDANVRNRLQGLFDIAKNQDLGQLAAMSQEIGRSSTAVPGNANGPQQGELNLNGTKQQQQAGQTTAQNTTLQQMLDLIKKSAANLKPEDLAVARKALTSATRTARKKHPNPGMTAGAAQGQPQNPAVISTG